MGTQAANTARLPRIVAATLWWGMCRNGRGGKRMYRWHAAAVLVAFMIMQAAVPTLGIAGGVIKYHVKVRNDIPITTYDNGWTEKITCTVYLDRFQANSQSATLSPGATHTFTVDGPNCPHGLSGDCKSEYGPSFSMYRRCLTGKEDTWDCTAACWGSDWFIRMHSDRTAHFEKE
jgi:hypothetical protein